MIRQKKVGLMKKLIERIAFPILKKFYDKYREKVEEICSLTPIRPCYITFGEFTHRILRRESIDTIALDTAISLNEQYAAKLVEIEHYIAEVDKRISEYYN